MLSADYPKVDVLHLRYTSVNFGADKSLGSELGRGGAI